ncbi:PO21 protein, partial [Pachyramphus minor]|nr:PO21 protein [Pachyramphus minor]
KAFDTINHQCIILGLEQKGIDSHIINLIKNMYENIYTHIGTKNEKSDPIQIQMDVKQGDPVSPLLFNLAVDLLLCKLEESGKGFHHRNSSITTMAFADNLVLLSGSWEGMKRNIEILEMFCNPTSLKTQGQE